MEDGKLEFKNIIILLNKNKITIPESIKPYLTDLIKKWNNKNKTLNLPMMDRAEAALRNFIEKAKRLPTLASRISQFDAQLSQIEEFERFK